MKKNIIYNEIGNLHLFKPDYITENKKSFLSSNLIKEFLTENGIGTGIHYPIVLYKQPFYEKMGITGNCPEAEKAASEVISLPVHPSLTVEELDTIIETVKKGSEELL